MPHSKLLILTSVILMACRHLEYAGQNSGGNAENTTLLLVGILSAPNNSAARSSIRQTWKTLAQGRNIMIYFLIGNTFCPIHPSDRISEYSCDPFEFFQSSGQPVSSLGWTPLSQNSLTEGSPKFTVTSFSFRANFPIIVRGIRVWKGGLQGSSTAVVNFKSAKTGEVIFSIPLNLPLSGSSYNKDDWIEPKTMPFSLPKYYDAELELVSKNFLNQTNSEEPHLLCYGVSSWFNFSGAIKFTTQFWPDSGWTTFSENSCSPLSLLIELKDFEDYWGKRNSRDLEWQIQTLDLSTRVKSEANLEKDILFINVLDVYKNIPYKLMKFYEWADSNKKFSFILKSDDDTFIDILAVEQYLVSVLKADEESSKPYLWWWGRLRQGLPVERHGKWQELDYRAPVYPPFPCGSAYVLNREVIRFLVTSSRWLHVFQGEDTSVGIWLSGAHPITPKNASCVWSCGRECHEHSCNLGQLSVNEMYSVWHQYQKGHNLC